MNTDKFFFFTTNEKFISYKRMMISRSLSIVIFCLQILVACNDSKKEEAIVSTHQSINLVTSPDSVLSTDYNFFGDSILKGHKGLMASIVNKYNRDTCVPMIYKKKNLKESFEGMKGIGDINNDGKNDSIFILDPLNWCEYDSGQSYYFTDTTLPRLVSESYCCHPYNFFKVADIDEDGFYEVGFYHSSCVSRYKSLRIFIYKNRKWQEIARSTFDILTQDPKKIKFESLVHKIAKNQFTIKTFIDNKQYWDTISLN